MSIATPVFDIEEEIVLSVTNVRTNEGKIDVQRAKERPLLSALVFRNVP